MYQHSYISTVISKQPGYWRIELKPVKKPTVSTCTKQRKAPAHPLSLQQFIRSVGGMNPEYNQGAWSGEIRMVRDSGKQGVMPGVFNRFARLTFEELAEECRAAGYLAEASIDELLFGLAKDIEATLTGERRNRVYGHTGLDYATSLDLERWESMLPEEAAA